MMNCSVKLHSAPPSTLRLTRSEWLVFILFLLCCAYFNGGSQWNQNARFDAVMAFVEPGYPESRTFSIDRFLTDPQRGDNTGDWSFYRGHFYANKAPGTILLGTVVYLPLFYVERFCGADPHGPLLELFNLYLINLIVSGLAGALALLFFKRLVQGLGVEKNHALALTCILGFGTMMLPYATQFWGHVTAASWICAGLFFLLLSKPKSHVYAGFCLGMAVYCEYLCAVTVVAVGIFLFATNRSRLPHYILGGLFPLLAFMLYHWACFGSPFVLATHYFNPIFKTDGHMFGFFTLGKLGSLLFSPYRGLLLHMPVLLGSLFGIALWIRRNWRDPMLWLVVANLLAYLLFNASFNGWHGGWTVCARYQIVALPFWVLPLKEIMTAPIWQVRATKMVALTIVVLSVFNMSAVAFVSPTGLYPPEVMRKNALGPLYGITYQALARGECAPIKSSFSRNGPARWRACNAGDLIGLHGLWSLFPFAAILTVGVILMARCTREPGMSERTMEENECL